MSISDITLHVCTHLRTYVCMPEEGLHGYISNCYRGSPCCQGHPHHIVKKKKKKNLLSKFPHLNFPSVTSRFLFHIRIVGYNLGRRKSLVSL